MHGWSGTEAENSIKRAGKEILQQNTQQMLTLKSQPQVTITGQNLWGFLSQFPH